MNYIDSQISKDTQVVLVPSTNEISHIYPLPQPSLATKNFAGSRMSTSRNMPVLASNPSIIKINDISIGFINSDVIKDMCINMCVKNPTPVAGQPQNRPKIDMVLQSMLQQKSFYPLYPGGAGAPIEWD